jgi:nucleoid-associated protein YgaU
MPISIHSRYYGLPHVEVDERLSLAQRPPAPAEAYPDGLVHEVVDGDTLDLLARRYYGREDLWWRIADANPRRFPHEWVPGDKLVIPPIRVATRTAAR